jgi:hypothetical protein
MTRKKTDDQARAFEPMVRDFQQRLRVGTLWDGLDKRTALYQVVKSFEDGVYAHMGGSENVSFLEARLIEKLGMIEIALQSCMGWYLEQTKKNGGRYFPSQKFTGTFLRFLGEYRNILSTLGMKKRAKKLTFDDYLKNKGTKDEG